MSYGEYNTTMHNNESTERPSWVLPGRLMVKVTLADGGTRVGQLLVPIVLEPDTEKVTVEYQTPSGAFACRILKRSQIETLG